MFNLKFFKMSEAEKAMQTLTQQQYNAVVTGLSLSPDNFQLYQGTATTGATSEWIWNILDAIPPKSINNLKITKLSQQILSPQVIIHFKTVWEIIMLHGWLI